MSVKKGMVIPKIVKTKFSNKENNIVKGEKVLVVYFSAQGPTENIAKYGNWLDGKWFSSSASNSVIKAFTNSIK